MFPLYVKHCESISLIRSQTTFFCWEQDVIEDVIIFLNSFFAVGCYGGCIYNRWLRLLMFPRGGSWCHRCCSRSTSLRFGGNHCLCWQRVLFCQGALSFSPCVTSPTLVPRDSWSHTRRSSFCSFLFQLHLPLLLSFTFNITFRFHLPLIL